MDWLLPAVLSSIATSILVVLVYLYLYLKYPAKHFLYWFISWILVMLRFLFRLLILSYGQSMLLMIGLQLFSLYSMVFFMYGTFQWLGRRSPWHIVVMSVLVIAWGFIANSLQLPRLSLLIPSFFYSALVFFITAYAVFRSRDIQGFLQWALGISLILYGLHKLQYPFFYDSPGFAPIAYLVDSIFTLMLAFGFIIAYFEKDRRAFLSKSNWMDSLLRYSPLPIMIVDKQGKIEFINTRFIDLLGYTLKDMPDLNSAFDLIADNPQLKQEIIQTWEEVISNLEAGTTVRPRVFPTRNKQGNTLWIEYHIKIVEKKFLYFLIDMTHHKQVESELVKASKMEVLQLLASGLGHDYNNILASILGNTELLKLKSRPEWDQDRYIENIVNAVSHASDLTRQLIAFTRHSRPATDISDIREVLTDAARFSIIGADIDLMFDIDSELWFVRNEIGSISQVVNNLVINAVQAMPGGGRIRLEAHNRILENHSILKSGKYVHISVEDEGQGIDPGILDKIYDPYFTTKELGSGLGLAITFSIIKGMNGYIECTSRQGKGTRFDIYIPGFERTRDGVSRRNRRGEVDGQSQSIILVEDEADILEFIRDTLDIHHFKVRTFPSAVEAWNYWQSLEDPGSEYQLIISDFSLPDSLNGEDLYKKIRECDTKTPFIIMSGYSDRFNQHLSKDPAFKFIEKPFTMKRLMDTIRSLVQK